MGPGNVSCYNHFSCPYQYSFTLTGVIPGGVLDRRKEEGREVSRKAQLVQNTVTHNSLIRTPKDYDYPYHLQEDYHLHTLPVSLY